MTLPHTTVFVVFPIQSRSSLFPTTSKTAFLPLRLLSVVMEDLEEFDWKLPAEILTAVIFFFLLLLSLSFPIASSSAVGDGGPGLQRGPGVF